MVLLCKEIRETLIDLTVENRLTLRERNFKTVDCWKVFVVGSFQSYLLERFFGRFFIGRFLFQVFFIGRLIQSYLRLLHSLLSGLGEAISATGQMNLFYLT